MGCSYTPATVRLATAGSAAFAAQVFLLVSGTTFDQSGKTQQSASKQLSKWPLRLYLVLPPLGRGRAVLAWRVAGSVRLRPPLCVWRFSPLFPSLEGHAVSQSWNPEWETILAQAIAKSFFAQAINVFRVCANNLPTTLFLHCAVNRHSALITTM